MLSSTDVKARAGLSVRGCVRRSEDIAQGYWPPIKETEILKTLSQTHMLSISHIFCTSYWVLYEETLIGMRYNVFFNVHHFCFLFYSMFKAYSINQSHKCLTFCFKQDRKDKLLILKIRFHYLTKGPWRWSEHRVTSSEWAAGDFPVWGGGELEKEKNLNPDHYAQPRQTTKGDIM